MPYTSHFTHPQCTRGHLTGHFTCPLHKWPLPCSTLCWALYHSCPFPSAASHPWALLFQKQAAVARGRSYLPPLGGFHMALLEKAPADQVILGTFPGALWSRQQEKVSLHFPDSEWEAFVCFWHGHWLVHVIREQSGSQGGRKQHGLSPVSSPGVVSSCHSQWQRLMHWKN